MVRSRAHPKAGRPLGSADGHTKEEMATLREKAGQEADRIIQIMEDEDVLQPTDDLLGNDKEIAKEALKETIVILRTPGDMRNKLAAARTLLEYTRAKPASTSNVTVSTAEEFLGALLAKEQAKG